MKRLGLDLLVCLTAVAGLACLPEDPEVNGRLLYGGIGIERPEFRKIDGQPWVQFEVRRARAEWPLSGKMDVHLVNWLDGTHRVLLEGRSERPGWPRSFDADGNLFYMVDERREAGGTFVGTLVRLSLTEGVQESLPNVVSYTLNVPERRKFFYQQYLPEEMANELHVRDITGRDQNLGVSARSAQFVGERIYFVGGEEKTLFRVPSFGAEPEPLRRKVERYQLHGSENLAVVAVSDSGKVRTVILDLRTRLETPLPVDNPCCWLELGADTFVFADAAANGKPTELHYYTLSTGVDRVVRLPDGIPNILSMSPRPPTGREIIISDLSRRLTVYRPLGDPMFEMTNLVPSVPAFMPDGRYLVFIEPDPPPPPPAVSTVPMGRLFVQDAAHWQDPPRMLSPKGAAVPIDPIGYRVRGGEDFSLLFWARYGLGGSDLYLANPDTGATLKVAQGIGAVAVGDRHVLGVIRISQDLTGELVFRDFLTGQEQLIERGVADMQIMYWEGLGDIVAFVVRERMPSSRRNGLWATTLEPMPPPMESPGSDRRQLENWPLMLEAGDPGARPQ